MTKVIKLHLSVCVMCKDSVVINRIYCKKCREENVKGCGKFYFDGLEHKCGRYAQEGFKLNLCHTCKEKK